MLLSECKTQDSQQSKPLTHIGIVWGALLKTLMDTDSSCRMQLGVKTKYL